MNTKDRILIVDGEIFCRTVICSLFRKNGFTVRVTDTGEKALSIITRARRKYDLVFIDLELPGRSGFELIKKLRKDHADIRVFVVSGYQDKTMFIDMLKKDCNKVSDDARQKLLS